MAKFTAKQRQSIALRGKRALGKMQKQSASDKRIFMSSCIDQLTNSGDADNEDDAREICELIWSEGDTSEFE
jgi:hypothetical protein